MKKNLTEVVFIIDRSGSMSHLTDDTIGGFNSMIEDQKAKDGEAFITTILFDDQYEVLHDHVNIQEVKPITRREYFARGMTALHDAVGKTINSVGKRLSDTPEEERPEKVVFVITTDGMENSSREFTKSAVKDMIEHQQSKYSWTFMFLGANMDATTEAAGLGINVDFARTYTNTSIGTTSVYTATSMAMSAIRDAADWNVQGTSDASYKAVVDALDEVE